MPGMWENKGDILRRVRKGALLPRLRSENRFYQVYVFGFGKIGLRCRPQVKNRCGEGETRRGQEGVVPASPPRFASPCLFFPRYEKKDI